MKFEIVGSIKILTTDCTGVFLLVMYTKRKEKPLIIL